MLTFVELTHFCTESIQPPYVYLKAKHYKYFPTKVYPDKEQNTTNPRFKKHKTITKTFLATNFQQLKL
jgi:hypothetical protein